MTDALLRGQQDAANIMRVLQLVRSVPGGQIEKPSNASRSICLGKPPPTLAMASHETCQSGPDYLTTAAECAAEHGAVLVSEMVRVRGCSCLA